MILLYSFWDRHLIQPTLTIQFTYLTLDWLPVRWRDRAIYNQLGNVLLFHWYNRRRACSPSLDLRAVSTSLLWQGCSAAIIQRDSLSVLLHHPLWDEEDTETRDWGIFDDLSSINKYHSDDGCSNQRLCVSVF